MSKEKYFIPEEHKGIRSGLSEGFLETSRGTCLQATSSADTPNEMARDVRFTVVFRISKFSIMSFCSQLGSDTEVDHIV